MIPSAGKGQHACQQLKSTLATSSSSVGVSPPSSSFLPAPVLSRWQVLRSFSGADLVAGKADEAAGLPPGNEDNAACCRRCPEKPCCLLRAEGQPKVRLEPMVLRTPFHSISAAAKRPAQWKSIHAAPATLPPSVRSLGLYSLFYCA